MSVAGFVITAAFAFYVCAFKAVDFDFWWHIKAGEILWRTKSLIRIDPFACTRAGMPYLSTHEALGSQRTHVQHVRARRLSFVPRLPRPAGA